MQQTIQDLNQKIIQLQLKQAESGGIEIFDREEELEQQLAEKERKITELEEKLKKKK
jgi:hypothetical protein